MNQENFTEGDLVTPATVYKQYNLYPNKTVGIIIKDLTNASPGNPYFAIHWFGERKKFRILYHPGSTIRHFNA